jgi:hypothetical protein
LVDRKVGRRGRGRFSVALSFAGEQRKFIERLAKILAESFCRERVLYDEFHAAEFTVVDLDEKLQNLYRDESDLVVVVTSAEYNQKHWCQSEWRAIRSKLLHEDPKRLMVLSADDVVPTGIYPTIDGQIALASVADHDMEARRIHDLLVARWHQVWLGNGYTTFPIHRLLRVVEGFTFGKTLVSGTWAQCYPPPPDRTPPTDLFDAILTLAALGWQATGAHPLLQFVEELRARPELDAQLRDAFDEWLDVAVQRRPTSRQIACALPKRERPVASKEEPYLLVKLWSPIGHPGRYCVEAWLRGVDAEQSLQPRTGEEFERADLEVAVADVLLQAVSSAEATKLGVEFIAPRELLDLPFDRWEYADELGDLTRVGVLHRTVVKSAERLSRPGLRSALQARWVPAEDYRERAIALTNWPDVSGSGVVFEGCEDRTDHVIQALAKSKVACALLDHPPPATPGSTHDLYNALLKSGVGIALWVRPKPGDAARPGVGPLRGVIDKQVLDGLPESTRVRRVGAEKAPAVGEVILLWDDPAHAPPEEALKPPATRPKGPSNG